jgi:hypothetical protein
MTERGWTIGSESTPKFQRAGHRLASCARHHAPLSDCIVIDGQSHSSTMARFRVVGFAALVFLPHLMMAQATLADLTSGARIRVTAREAGVLWPATAVIDSISAETLYVRSLSDPPTMRRLPRVAIALTSVSRLDLPRAAPTHWDHARTGALVGLGLSLLTSVAYVIHEHATCSGPECFGEGMAWIGIVALVPVGTTAGAMVGLVLPTNRWQRVDLQR